VLDNKMVFAGVSKVGEVENGEVQREGK